MTASTNGFTALVKHDGPWWIGWVAEVPGVNCQEKTREQLLMSLQGALVEMMQMRCEDMIAAVEGGFSNVEPAP